MTGQRLPPEARDALQVIEALQSNVVEMEERTGC